MAQVRGLDPKVDGCLALFRIHRVNRMYGAVVMTSWHVTVPCKLSYIIIIILYYCYYRYNLLVCKVTWCHTLVKSKATCAELDPASSFLLSLNTRTVSSLLRLTMKALSVSQQ